VKSPILIVATLLSGAALAALAADPPKELTPQQQRMSDCSKASKGLKGDEHKKFMSDCLKKDSTIDVSKPAAGSATSAGKPATPVTTAATPAATPAAKPVDGKTAQQEKMKTCNADADKDKLKGDARKKFMSECLKGGATAAAEPVKAEPKKETQQEKMKSCNALADKDKLKGDDRKKFMSDCLKGAA